MAVLKYTQMPDAATQAQIKARGDTIQIVPPAGQADANAANTSAYFPNPYQQGQSTVKDLSGTQPLNPYFFANQDTANRIAQAQGGQVTTEAGWGGPGISSAANLYGVNVNGQNQNPALTADWVNKYGPEYAAKLAGTPGLANLGMPAASPSAGAGGPGINTLPPSLPPGGGPVAPAG